MKREFDLFEALEWPIHVLFILAMIGIAIEIGVQIGRTLW